MSEWQAIETAPRDGRQIMLAMYRERRLIWLTEDRWDQDEGQWSDDPSLEPTHWQPLPEPPHA